MKCLNCKNTKDFIILGNQNVNVEFINSQLKKAEKEDFNITDIYPVICGRCRSEDIDFKYREIEEILTKAR